MTDAERIAQLEQRLAELVFAYIVVESRMARLEAELKDQRDGLGLVLAAGHILTAELMN